MKRQIEMEETMLRAHREFMGHLEKSLNLLDRDIEEAREMTHICTDEWCLTTEGVLDELAKIIFAISEPRWLSQEDSRKISELRHRIHDLYARYKSVRK
jgi:DNA polymerase III delta prime subunit